ncbi:hypothetical protein [Longispora albida]|uniref:hypothetical protein n=1 Tax=Longispora albida TaxID=203523 RepID=UPI000373517E|nr:hypothetical protein [Longispora albida]
MRARAVAIAMLVLATGAACGEPDREKKAGPEAPATATMSPAAPGGTPASGRPAVSASAAKSSAPAAKAMSCADVQRARVRGSRAPYTAAGFVLTGGRHTTPDGTTVAAQQPCATGNLDPHGGLTTVATVMASMDGTTGRYWSLMLCKLDAGAPVCTVAVMLDDREPVESVAIAKQTATVVYLTRTPGTPPAAVNVRRTVTYQFGGNTLHELSRTDAPA